MKTTTTTRTADSMTWTTTDAAPAPLAAPGHGQPDAAALARVVNLACDAVDSQHTRRAYRRHLENFVTWSSANGAGLNRATVQAYKRHLAETASPGTVNQALSAIRKLAEEAQENGLIDFETRRAICDVAGIKTRGTKTGNWLTLKDAERLINTPDAGTLKGARDRAILAVMIGAGLRREEIAALTPGHLRHLDGRWTIADLTGKHGRTRTIPIATWIKYTIDAYLLALGSQPDAGAPLFVPLRKGNHPQPGGITPQAVWYIVEEHAHAAHLVIAPHDLRRSYAKLARKNGAAIEQIQITLGHASLATTQRYLGTDLDLENAPSDAIMIRLAA